MLFLIFTKINAITSLSVPVYPKNGMMEMFSNHILLKNKKQDLFCTHGKVIFAVFICRHISVLDC